MSGLSPYLGQPPEGRGRLSLHSSCSLTGQRSRDSVQIWEGLDLSDQSDGARDSANMRESDEPVCPGGYCSYWGSLSYEGMPTVDIVHEWSTR